MKTKSTKKTKKQGLQINFSNYFNFLPSLITGDNSSMTIIYDINFVCAYDCRICVEKVLFDSQRCFFFTYENACRFSYNTYLEKNIVYVIFSLNPSYFNFTKKSINNLIW